MLDEKCHLLTSVATRYGGPRALPAANDRPRSDALNSPRVTDAGRAPEKEWSQLVN